MIRTCTVLIREFHVLRRRSNHNTTKRLLFSTSGTSSSLSVPVYSVPWSVQQREQDTWDQTYSIASTCAQSSKQPVNHLAYVICPLAVPDHVCRVPIRGFFRPFHCTEPMFAESGGNCKCKQEWIPTSSIHAIHIAEIRYSLWMYDIDQNEKEWLAASETTVLNTCLYRAEQGQLLV